MSQDGRLQLKGFRFEARLKCMIKVLFLLMVTLLRSVQAIISSKVDCILLKSVLVLMTDDVNVFPALLRVLKSI